MRLRVSSDVEGFTTNMRPRLAVDRKQARRHEKPFARHLASPGKKRAQILGQLCATIDGLEWRRTVRRDDSVRHTAVPSVSHAFVTAFNADGIGLFPKCVIV
jgi:hypothetical protein